MTRLARQAARAPYQKMEIYTKNSAYQTMEDMVGTIEVGKKADIVVWTEPPRYRPHGDQRVKVLYTVSDGRIVYKG